MNPREDYWKKRSGIERDLKADDPVAREKRLQKLTNGLKTGKSPLTVARAAALNGDEPISDNEVGFGGNAVEYRDPVLDANGKIEFEPEEDG